MLPSPNHRMKIGTQASDGIGINALAILSDHATLDRYFRAEVIGGPGAFVLPARRFADFGPAIANKIAMEVA